MIKVPGEEDYYCISLFQDQLKASGFWWILNDDKNNNFVPDTLQNALYISDLKFVSSKSINKCVVYKISPKPQHNL